MRNSRRTILVVEDDAILRDTLIESLELEGYATLAARNGEEGLALARREGPDLVLTDAAMPVCDGYELIRALQADKRTRDIPVVMISARVESASKTKAIGAGAVAFVRKPFEFKELLNRIRDLS